MAKNDKRSRPNESGETQRGNNNRSGGTGRSLSDQDTQYSGNERGSGESSGSGNSSGTGRNKAANPSQKDSHR